MTCSMVTLKMYSSEPMDTAASTDESSGYCIKSRVFLIVARFPSITCTLLPGIVNVDVIWIIRMISRIGTFQNTVV